VPAVDARKNHAKEAPAKFPGLPDRPVARYFSNAMALFALLEACVILPALHAASASFTSDCALVTLEERGLWLLAVAPLLARGDWTFWFSRGDCTSWFCLGDCTFWFPRGDWTS